MYSELMEDAIVGVWGEEDNLDLVLFLSQCSEGIGGADDFCASFHSILDSEGADSRQGLDAVALQVKNNADRRLDSFIKARKKQNAPNPDVERDGPPPGLDEFEYIDWIITH